MSDVKIAVQPGLGGRDFDDMLSDAMAEVAGDGDEEMPELADMPPVEAKRPPPFAAASAPPPPSSSSSLGAGAGAHPMLVDPRMLMDPTVIAQLRQTMNPAQLAAMQMSMQQMNPEMMHQMRAAMMQMTPQQRQAMQQQMHAVAQQMPAGDFAQIQELAKRNAQAMMQQQQQQQGKPGATAMSPPSGGGGGGASHGHSHGGGNSHGHSHGGGGGGEGAMTYASLQKQDAAAVIKAARAELARPFIPKTHIVYECPRCSYEAPATYPMVSEMSCGPALACVCWPQPPPR
jgi:hypothetical protein